MHAYFCLGNHGEQHGNPTQKVLFENHAFQPMFNSLGEPSLIGDQNCLAHDALGNKKGNKMEGN